MTKLLSKLTRPRGAVHLCFIALVIAYGLVVEICEARLAPFEGFWVEENWKQTTGMSLSTLRVILILLSVWVLGGAIFALWPSDTFAAAKVSRTRRFALLFIEVVQKRLVAMMPDKTPFLIAYLCLHAVVVFGLVLFMITGYRLDFYGFAIPMLVGLILLTQIDRTLLKK